MAYRTVEKIYKILIRKELNNDETKYSFNLLKYFIKLVFMNYQEVLDMMKKIQDHMLTFIEREDNIEENFLDLQQIFIDYKIKESKQLIISTLHLITDIANNCYRGANFFDKIFKIILIFQNQIKQSFLNSEIYNIFSSNKRLLLFLIEEKMLIIDKYIYNIISSEEDDYFQYFYPEIEPFIQEDNENKNNKCEINENFYSKRKIGENDEYICQLIQKHSSEDLITDVNKK